jgi:predicted RNase H-like nuclease (RuvC/YqgF family)
MILNIDVEELVEEIESGKKNLFDTIKEFMVKIDELEDEESKYSICDNCSKDDEIEDLEFQINVLENKVDKLEDENSDLKKEVKDNIKLIAELENKICNFKIESKKWLEALLDC